MPTFRVTLIRERNKLHKGGRTADVPYRSWTFEARDEEEVRRLLAEAREQGAPAHVRENVRGYVLADIEKLIDCPRCNAGELCVEHGRAARRIGEFNQVQT